MCSSDLSCSNTRSPFLWPSATLLVGDGHLWLTQTENLHPHCKRPGTVCLVWNVFINCPYGMCFFAQHGVGDIFRFSTFCIQYVIYLALFVFNVIPERKPSKSSYNVLTEVCALKKYFCVCLSALMMHILLVSEVHSPQTCL